MKTQKTMLGAFLLNLLFSLAEFLGGLFTGSVAILSDAVHDIGDAAGIGFSWLLERKSQDPPDDHYTFGYRRYTVLGGFITNGILLLGSFFVIGKAINRLIHPVPIHDEGMLLLALLGVAINLLAAYLTREGHSVNQKAVNLHMIEDVLGWVAVLLGAVLIRFTGWTFIDPLLSLAVAVFILIHAVKNSKEILDVFLEKPPHGITVDAIRTHLLAMDGILDVHHIHLWTLDGQSGCATMHVVTDEEPMAIKRAVREELRKCGIMHTTLELELSGEPCEENTCRMQASHHSHHHHHHC